VIPIPLPCGRVATISDCDAELILQHQWQSFTPPKGKAAYAITRINEDRTAEGKDTRRTIRMHRLIMGLDGPEVDHEDGNGLNNTRENLRHATHSQNVANRGKCSGFSGAPCSSCYKGVSWSKQAKKWKAYIRVAGHSHHLGLFTTELDAALAYDIAAAYYFGPFARLNLPPQT
jgi:hypothetical protein